MSTEEQEKAIIALYKANPILWNTKAKEYHIKEFRKQRLDMIARQLNMTSKYRLKNQTFIFIFLAENLSLKFRNLRTIFFRNFREVEKKRKAKSSWLPSWKHFADMLFLLDPHPTRKALIIQPREA